MITAVLKQQKNNIKADSERVSFKAVTVPVSAVKGVLADTYLKKPDKTALSFDKIQDSLLIHESEKYAANPELDKETSSGAETFSIKKAAMPLIAGTLALTGGLCALSLFLKKASGNLLKTKSFEQLPDLAVNMNITEEPQFAIYRAVRDPNFRNIAAAYGVFIMSGVTIAAKNFVDGAKEIWVKKRAADINAELNENLISVENSVFSSKLKIQNDIMKENLKHFQQIINSKPDKISNDKSGFKGGKTNIFAAFQPLFKGNQPKENNTPAKKGINKNLKYLMYVSAAAAGILLAGKYSFANFRKALDNTQQFADNYTEGTLNKIRQMAEQQDSRDIPAVVEMMKSIAAKPVLAEEIGKKYNLPHEKVKEIIDDIEQSRKTIFADAPQALGGIPKKVQYYCYIDEPRGHLYNWIINPENKYTKIIFASFTMSAAIGYVFKQTMDALKEAAVCRENAKTELYLKKKLAAVEVKNFKTKKESAVMPLRDNFEKQAAEGKKSKEELKKLADNTLREIKNGPPYIFS